jgi:3-oxoacyl-[acyl-carrier protein] reductase
MIPIEQVCIITGAGSGIGQATAIALSNRNVYRHIVLIGRNNEKLIETKTLMDDSFSSAYYYSYDLSDANGVALLIEEIYTRFGRIDALLNIAGYTEPASLLNTTIQNFAYTYQINVFAVFAMIKECVKYMKTAGGKILNVASTAGMSPRPGWLSYASSKAAVISMSETLSAELSEYKILVYCVSPGRCATALRRKLAPDENPETIMQPSEVAEVVSNLLVPNEMCLDGQNIIIRKQQFYD